MAKEYRRYGLVEINSMRHINWIVKDQLVKVIGYI